MLYDLITSIMSGNIEDIKSSLIIFLMWVPIVLFSLSFHEMAHAYAADKLGDPTAKNLGRVTLNPLKHLDPIGTLAMFVIGFGWAKPVPVFDRNFEKPRKGMAITSLAGPLSNLILAIICAVACGILNFVGSLATTMTMYDVCFYVFIFFYYGTYLNIALAVFNFIPVPPLDGSRILGLIIPAKYYYSFVRYERYIGIGFMVLVIVLLRLFNISLISWITDPITDGLLWLVGAGGEFFGRVTWG